MDLNKIIEVVDEAYGDSLIMQYHKKPKGNYGDGLAKFIAVELAETFDKEDPIGEAIRKLESAQRELQGCINALVKVEEGT